MQKWLCLLPALLLLSGCAQTPAETTAEETVPVETADTAALAEAFAAMTEAATQPYIIKTTLKAVVDDDLHNADVNLPQVVFRDNSELTGAVFTKITEPFLMAYADYTDGAGIDFNWFTTDYQVYESEDYLAVTVLSYDAGTYVTCPKIIGAVVDLETMTMLTMEEVLQTQGKTTASVEEKIRNILPAVWDAKYPLWMEALTDAYLDTNGDLIVIASTSVPQGDPPSNPYLYYNAAQDSISIWPYSETLEDFSTSFQSVPEEYVFDQAVYDAYYSEDHIPETIVIYHDDPRLAPEIMVVPEIEPEIMIAPEIEPEQ